ncbi:hypothetical protein M9H77_06686 [Catharanthus roseus]|uniref:Uncharacterized protein n=1 Tax=Catharanthus roseus TaxID=4058 RepID=A0ACC0BST2_CATRO|nr:hypothetical protein M9H77_06686 [Catharanthus roseus]
MEESKEVSLGGFIASKLKEDNFFGPCWRYFCDISILSMPHEEEKNRNHNEGPGDPLIQEVDGTLRSLQQQMGNIERNVGVLSARIDRQESMIGQRRGFHNYENLTPRLIMIYEDSSPHANFGLHQCSKHLLGGKIEFANHQTP